MRIQPIHDGDVEFTVCTFEQIAKVLGMSTQGAINAHNRAIEKMRDGLLERTKPKPKKRPYLRRTGRERLAVIEDWSKTDAAVRLAERQARRKEQARKQKAAHAAGG